MLDSFQIIITVGKTEKGVVIGNLFFPSYRAYDGTP